MGEKDPFTRDDQTRFTMRIDVRLMEKIRESATANKRSAAKEIEFILESYFREHPTE